MLVEDGAWRSDSIKERLDGRTLEGLLRLGGGLGVLRGMLVVSTSQVELAYPVNEGTLAGFLTMMNNLIGMVFFLLFFIPSMSQVVKCICQS